MGSPVLICSPLQIEEKMLNTTEVEVKIYKCETCHTGWSTYPPKCGKDLGHEYITKQGKKYWFECKKCKRRDTCVETLGPRFDCHCGARDWKKTTQGCEWPAPDQCLVFTP